MKRPPKRLVRALIALFTLTVFSFFIFLFSGPVFSRATSEKALFNSLFASTFSDSSDTKGLENNSADSTEFKSSEQSESIKYSRIVEDLIDEETLFILKPLSNPEIRSNRIYLEDLFEIKYLNETSRRVSEISITTSATPGRVRKIEPAVIYRRLEIKGFSKDSYIWLNPGTLYISSPSKIVRASEIRSFISSEIVNRAQGMDIEYDFAKIPERLVIMDVDYRLVAKMATQLKSNVNTIRVKIMELTGAQRELTALNIRVNIHFFDNLLIADRVIYPGETMTTSNCSVKRVRTSPENGNQIKSTDQLYGMVTSRKINPGTALKLNMFQKPWLIKGNQNIKLEAQVGNVIITVPGRALSNGSKNETIKVINTSNDRMISAKVIDTGVARILVR